MRSVLVLYVLLMSARKFSHTNRLKLSGLINFLNQSCSNKTIPECFKLRCDGHYRIAYDCLKYVLTNCPKYLANRKYFREFV